MEVYPFEFDISQKALSQQCIEKLIQNQKYLLSAQLLFVEKNEDNKKMISIDLNSFTYHKIVQSLQNFGTIITNCNFETLETIQTKNCKIDSFFIQLNEKLGARIDDTILKNEFVSNKNNDSCKVLNGLCKVKIFKKTDLKLFICLKKLENKIKCFIFGLNANNAMPLTKAQIHHFLLCLHAFTTL